LRRQSGTGGAVQDDSPPPGDGGSGGSPSTNGISYSFDTNGLWLEMVNVTTNGFADLNLHNATNHVYAIWGTPDFISGWTVLTEVWPTSTSVMPFTVPLTNQQTLFMQAEDWTGVTENGNTTPDWWFWEYFGTTALSDTNLDSQGNTLLSDYQNGINPNIINFSVNVANQYFNTPSATVQISVSSGTPAYMAALVDDTNWANASWKPYNSNLVVNLGSVEGWHTVWVGLKGLPATAQKTWNSIPLDLILTPPVLVITNPIPGTVTQPTIEVQGYCTKPLAGITFDLSNATGLFTNQQAFVLSQHTDAATRHFTTNSFQAFDVPLTNGNNVVTFHATDLAGNTTTTNITYTLDYTGKTNPPVIQIYWPQNGDQVTGSTFTLRGSLDDFTASLTAQIVDASGNTNTLQGLVGRNGLFWVENAPLLAGTNYVTLTAMDAAGNISITNLAINCVNPGFTINDFTSELGGNPRNVIPMVTGTIALTNYTLWVNGIQATQDGQGNWVAYSVPLGPGGTAVVEVRAIPNSSADNNGAGTGTAPPTDGTPGNPTAPDSLAAQTQIDQPMTYYLQEYHYCGNSINLETENCTGCPLTGGDTDTGQFDYVYMNGGSAGWNTSGSDSDCNGSSSGWEDMTFSWSCEQCPVTDVETDSGGDTNTYLVDVSYALVYSGSPNPMMEAIWESDVHYAGEYPDEECNSVTWDSHDTESINTQMTLQTGGKGVPGCQNVFQISVSASNYTSSSWSDNAESYCWNTAPVPPGQITVAGQTAGSDGNVYTVLPDNLTMDITPHAPPQRYSYSVGASEYTPQIQANGITLDPIETNITLCVGQQVNFTLTGSPACVLTLVHWNLPDKFVNAINYPNPSGSANYFKDNSLLYTVSPPDNIGTSCWYVNGTGGTVSATVTYSFANGQTATLPVIGVIGVYRPTVSMNQIQEPRFFTNTISMLGSATIKLGTPGQQTYGEMVYTVECDTSISGLGEITQTCQLSYNPNLGGFNFPDWRCDGAENYAGPAGITAQSIPVLYPALDDGPQNATIIPHSPVEVKGNYIDYIRFNPNTPGSIYVTLGTVTWNIDGKIAYQGSPPSWQLVIDSTPDPVGPDDSDQFPFYTQPR
jgi:hypothetical protein